MLPSQINILNQSSDLKFWVGRPSRLAQTQAPISNFTEIYPVVAALVHSNRRTDRQSDWRTKLIGRFHYYATAPKKETRACIHLQLDLNTGFKLRTALVRPEIMIDFKIRAHCCNYQCLKCSVRIITPSVTLSVNWANGRLTDISTECAYCT